MKLFKYEVPCIECSTDKIFWLEDGAPLVCPVDPAHTLVTDETVILKKVNDSPIFSQTDKMEVIAESRPPGHYTVFTSCGDGTGIGDGKDLQWNFANTDDEVTSEIPGYREKNIHVYFNEDIYIKEGAVYFQNAPFGCFVKMFVVCPAGGYYRDRNGAIQMAAVDTEVFCFVPKHFICGSCPQGDELNTEGCTRDPIPKGYYFKFEVYTPDTDNISTGHITLEIYRPRTILFPGESL